ncbi:MAG: hypothetical protein WC781_04365 [Candidatus Pacearchaeota archaeon]|jgi:hypothetical protein
MKKVINKVRNGIALGAMCLALGGCGTLESISGDISGRIVEERRFFEGGDVIHEDTMIKHDDFDYTHPQVMVAPPIISSAKIEYPADKPENYSFVCKGVVDNNHDGKLSLEEFEGIGDKFKIGERFFYVQRVPIKKDDKTFYTRTHVFCSGGEYNKEVSRESYSIIPEDNSVVIGHLSFLSGNYDIKTIDKKGKEIGSLKITLVNEDRK